MDALDEFYERHPELKGYRDTELRENTELLRRLLDKQNQLIRIMNHVASKYTKWSLAKDRFISEVIKYSSAIDTAIFSSSLSLQEAIDSVEREIASLKRQDEMMMRKQVRQVVVVKPVEKAATQKKSSHEVNHKELVIAGIGFVGGAASDFRDWHDAQRRGYDTWRVNDGARYK